MATIAEILAQHRATQFIKANQLTQLTQPTQNMQPDQPQEPQTMAEMKKMKKEEKEQINGTMDEIIEKIIEEKPTPNRLREALRNYAEIINNEEII